MKKETHECEICGHEGIDVEWQKPPVKVVGGYFCKDIEACWLRKLAAQEVIHGT